MSDQVGNQNVGFSLDAAQIDMHHGNVSVQKCSPKVYTLHVVKLGEIGGWYSNDKNDSSIKSYVVDVYNLLYCES